MESSGAKPEPVKQSRKKALNWVFRIATILVSAAIIWHFLGQVEWEELKARVVGANLALALLGAGVPLFFFWITDAAFTVKSFEWFDKPVPFRDYFVIKGAAYLLTLVNITFATGGVLLYFMRKTGISFTRQSGLLLWRVTVAGLGSAMALVLFLAVSVISFPDIASDFEPELIVPLALIVIVFTLESWAFWFRGGGIIYKRFSADYDSEFWSTFKNAAPRHWLKGFLFTVPPLFVNFTGMFLVARAFGINVPFVYFMCYIPLALFFSALPIAFGQLGTTTIAWQFFFSSFGDDSAIIAATLFIPSFRLVWRGLAGLASMPFAIGEIESLKKEGEKILAGTVEDKDED